MVDMAAESCTLQDMRHGRQQWRQRRQQTRRRRRRQQTRRAGCSGVSCVVAWCRQTLGCWQRAQLPSLLPPSPSSHTTIKTTKAVANDDGGGAGGGSSFRARRSGSGGIDDSRYRKHSALWGLVDPTGSTVYPHRWVYLPPSLASKRIRNGARDGPRNAMPELAQSPPVGPRIYHFYHV